MALSNLFEEEKMSSKLLKKLYSEIVLRGHLKKNVSQENSLLLFASIINSVLH